MVESVSLCVKDPMKCPQPAEEGPPCPPVLGVSSKAIILGGRSWLTTFLLRCHASRGSSELLKPPDDVSSCEPLCEFVLLLHDLHNFF